MTGSDVKVKVGVTGRGTRDIGRRYRRVQVKSRGDVAASSACEERRRRIQSERGTLTPPPDKSVTVMVANVTPPGEFTALVS